MIAAAARLHLRRCLRRPFLPLSAMTSAFSVLHGAPQSNSYSSAANANGSASNGGPSNSSDSQFTVTGLSRWSIANRQLPSVDGIRALHVYDFDNTRMQPPTRAGPWHKILTRRSLQDTLTEPIAMAGHHHRPSLEPRRLHERRLVA